MPRSWAIVTGAGSGIGAALTHRLLSADISVVAVGRRQSALDRTAAGASAEPGATASLLTLAADIASADGQAAILSAVPYEDEVRFLVHNAAVGDPSPVGGNMDVDAFRYSLEVNVVAPLALTQALLPRLSAAGSGGGRVLHLGTGVAHMVQPGTGTYGISKLAFHRLYQQLSVDLQGAGVWVGSARPGVVATEGMIDHVAKANRLGLPHAEYFNALFAEGGGGMQEVGVVAEFLWALLHACPAEEFGLHEYSVNQATAWWAGSDKAHL
jgi:benzil reductase ((S)-benzoin forming)